MQNEQHSIPATLQHQTLVVHFLQLQLGISSEISGLILELFFKTIALELVLSC